MALASDRKQQIYKAIALGADPKIGTPEEAEYAKAIKRDVDRIVQSGGMLDMPMEYPHDDDPTGDATSDPGGGAGPGGGPPTKPATGPIQKPAA